MSLCLNDTCILLDWLEEISHPIIQQMVGKSEISKLSYVQSMIIEWHKYLMILQEIDGNIGNSFPYTRNTPEFRKWRMSNEYFTWAKSNEYKIWIVSYQNKKERARQSWIK
jgi:hypothetical protein